MAQYYKLAGVDDMGPNNQIGYEKKNCMKLFSG